MLHHAEGGQCGGGAGAAEDSREGPSLEPDIPLGCQTSQDSGV